MEGEMVYILAVLLPPLGLLLNGQPFSAIFSVVLIVFSLIFGILFFAQVVFLLPSIHGVLAVSLKRDAGDDRRGGKATDRPGPPPGWGRYAIAMRGSKAPRR